MVAINSLNRGHHCGDASMLRFVCVPGGEGGARGTSGTEKVTTWPTEGIYILMFNGRSAKSQCLEGAFHEGSE